MGIVVVNDKIMKVFECLYCGSKKMEIIGVERDFLKGKEKEALMSMEKEEKKKGNEKYRPVLLCKNCSAVAIESFRIPRNFGPLFQGVEGLE